MRRFLVFLLLVLMLGAGGTTYVYKLALEKYDGPGPLESERIIVIPPGASVQGIAQVLLDGGVIDDALLFRAGVRFEGAQLQLKAGEFSFPAAVSMRETMELLRGGRTVVHRVTIPEGLTTQEIAALIDADPILQGPVGDLPGEGLLLPETYHFHRGAKRRELIDRMAAAQKALLEELWAGRAEDLPLASPEEAVILASIVEKETGVSSERELVAGVFINRLKKPMRLQSDPTVIYGITLGKGPLGRSLTRKDLKEATPYNTYVIDSLPPGPIANPGRDALVATLNPAETDYLYFVADGTGGHAFAKTLSEHNKNVARWRKIEKARKAAGAD